MQITEGNDLKQQATLQSLSSTGALRRPAATLSVVRFLRGDDLTPGLRDFLLGAPASKASPSSGAAACFLRLAGMWKTHQQKNNKRFAWVKTQQVRNPSFVFENNTHGNAQSKECKPQQTNEANSEMEKMDGRNGPIRATQAKRLGKRTVLL